jgi:hypothetical protein
LTEETGLLAVEALIVVNAFHLLSLSLQLIATGKSATVLLRAA